MAKKVDSFSKLMQTIPAEKEFTIAMVADSEDEVWTDIDTDIQAGEAWLIYGVEYTFENVDPTLPFPHETDALWAHSLQVHRNTDSDILLNHHDQDLMFQHQFSNAFQAAAAGSTSERYNYPVRFGRRTVTFSDQLRVLFRTYADVAAISATTVQIAGIIYYDRIKAPNMGASKLGHLMNL